MVFVDLKKAHDSVLRDILNWVLRRKRTPKMYINVIENLYEDSCISVNSMCGKTEDFRERVGVHLHSALNPYLFSVLMDKITKEIQSVLVYVCKRKYRSIIDHR